MVDERSVSGAATQDSEAVRGEINSARSLPYPAAIRRELRRIAEMYCGSTVPKVRAQAAAALLAASMCATGAAGPTALREEVIARFGADASVPVREQVMCAVKMHCGEEFEKLPLHRRFVLANADIPNVRIGMAVVDAIGRIHAATGDWEEAVAAYDAVVARSAHAAVTGAALVARARAFPAREGRRRAYRDIIRRREAEGARDASMAMLMFESVCLESGTGARRTGLKYVMERFGGEEQRQTRRIAARAAMRLAGLADSRRETADLCDRALEILDGDGRDMEVDAILRRKALATDDSAVREYFDSSIANASEPYAVAALMLRKAALLENREEKAAVYDAIVARFSDSRDARLRREVAEANIQRILCLESMESALDALVALSTAHAGNPDFADAVSRCRFELAMVRAGSVDAAAKIRLIDDMLRSPDDGDSESMPAALRLEKAALVAERAEKRRLYGEVLSAVDVIEDERYAARAEATAALGMAVVVDERDHAVGLCDRALAALARRGDVAWCEPLRIDALRLKSSLLGDDLLAPYHEDVLSTSRNPGRIGFAFLGKAEASPDPVERMRILDGIIRRFAEHPSLEAAEPAAAAMELKLDGLPPSSQEGKSFRAGIASRLEIEWEDCLLNVAARALYESSAETVAERLELLNRVIFLLYRRDTDPVAGWLAKAIAEKMKIVEDNGER